LLLPSASDTESALLQRIERIETRLTMSIPASEAPVPPPGEASKQFARRSQAPQADEAPATPAATAAVARPPVAAPPPTPAPAAPLPEAPPPVTAGQPDATAVRSMWTTVREKVRERRRPTDVMLDGAVVLAVEGDTLVLSHVSGPLAKRINEARNVEIIRDALKDALGVDWNVRCEAGAPTAPPLAERAAPAAVAAPEPEADEESMLAEVEHEEVAPRRDPEEVALELLQTELGARRIDG
jgi:DNA polymerase-3 subunit gamma/tau